MTESAIMVASADARDAAEHQPDKTLEGRLRAAMKRAAHFWMSTDENVRFQGAIIGVGLLLKDEGNEADYLRLEEEMAQVKALHAAMSGVPVAFENVLDRTTPPIGVINMWHETKRENP